MSRWNKLKLAFLTRIIGMSVITVFAVLVMIAVNLKGRKIEQSDVVDDSESRPALVSVIQLQSEPIEITKKYSGTIRPFERYMLSFKTAGRVIELGKNKQGRELDEGDKVTEGMILAKLDTRLLEAQKAELTVTKNFAQLEYEKALELSQNRGAISDTEFNQRKTELEVAKAKLAVIQTQIDDGVLRSKVSGVISKRLIKAGESVNLGQTVFELIQVDRVNLVVGVPESRIRPIIGTPENPKAVKAYVHLVGRDNADTVKTPLVGTVHQVSQTSDDKSGLFEVEILLDNRAGILRPGMIAISRIVVDRFDGFRIPADAAFFRESEVFAFVFGKNEVSTDEGSSDNTQPEDVEGDDDLTGVARKYVFADGDYEIQGNELVIRNMESDARQVIVGGHRRLVDGRKIKIVFPD